ncbi:MAG: DUF2341 domain-containing protein [Fibrobacter sp.]|nr:DUF2341 domain-containing protein [Fibrobacter sp.]
MINVIYHGRTRVITVVAGIILMIFALINVCCTSGDSIAGTGSQSGNGRILGVAYTADSTPAANAVVRVRLQNYTAAKALQKSSNAWRDLRTDASGKFSVDSLDTGKYFVEINDENANAVLFACTLSLLDSQADLQKGILQPTGTISGTFIKEVDSVAMHVQICGLERSGTRDLATGGFIIRDVPAGTFTVRVLAASSTYRPVDITGVTVTSDSVSSIGAVDYISQSTWNFSKRLYLNTTESGVPVSGMVRDFPVLVRLHADNFDFNSANPDGSDLLFTKSDGTVLPFEIEYWNASENRAVVWFKADTLTGGDSSRYVVMYWGNPQAVTMPDYKNVFDTTAHFAGVWHLNDTGLVSTDATVNGNNGTNSGCTSSDGLIGTSRRFTDSTFIKIPGVFNNPTNLTLSAWVASDTTTGQDVISLGDAILIRLDEHINSAGTTGSYHSDSLDELSSFSVTGSGVTLAKSGWRYVVYTHNSSTHTQTLYIDGLQVAVTNFTAPIYYTGVGKDTYLGIHGNGKTIFNFVGHLDEVRVQNAVMSDDWVRLCYENQKASDALIQFR